MSKHQNVEYIHLVISTKELQDIHELEHYLKKRVDEYCIATERGENGHPHIDSFFKLKKPMRTDNFKKCLVKALYSDIPKTELFNIKCSSNFIDPNPLYGYGYCVKEHVIDSNVVFDEEILTDRSIEYLNLSYQYYIGKKDDVKEAVAKIKSSTSEKPKKITVDEVADAFVLFLKELLHRQLERNNRIDDHLHLDVIRDSDNRETNYSQWFHEFIKHYRTIRNIPFSVYSKINQKTLVRYATSMLDTTADRQENAPAF